MSKTEESYFEIFYSYFVITFYKFYLFHDDPIRYYYETSKAGMHIIRPAEAFDLARKLAYDFVYLACLCTKTSSVCLKTY
jgi:hypothetical protein